MIAKLTTRAIYLTLGAILGLRCGFGLGIEHATAFDAGRFQGWRDCVREKTRTRVNTRKPATSK